MDQNEKKVFNLIDISVIDLKSEQENGDVVLADSILKKEEFWSFKCKKFIEIFDIIFIIKLYFNCFLINEYNGYRLRRNFIQVYYSRRLR